MFINKEFDNNLLHILEVDNHNRKDIIRFLSIIPRELIDSIKDDLETLEDNDNDFFYSEKSFRSSTGMFIYEIEETVVNIKIVILDVNNNVELCLITDKTKECYPYPIGHFQVVEENDLYDASEKSVDYYMNSKNEIRITDSIHGTKDVSLLITKLFKKSIKDYLGIVKEEKEEKVKVKRRNYL